MTGDRPPKYLRTVKKTCTMILIAVAKRTDREALVFLDKVVFLIQQR